MKIIAALLIVAFTSGNAFAGNLTVTVKGTDGKPVPDAVVTVYPGGQPTKAPIKVDFPTPGGPVKPMIRALPVRG